MLMSLTKFKPPFNTQAWAKPSIPTVGCLLQGTKIVMMVCSGVYIVSECGLHVVNDHNSFKI